MPDPVDTWFEREPVPLFRCCGWIRAHCDCFSKLSKMPPEKESKDLFAATNEVGTLPTQPACFNDAIEPQQQRETMFVCFESLTFCETSLNFIVTSFKRECCWNVPRCPTHFRLECAQFGACSISFHVQDSGTKTGSLSLLPDKNRQNRLILMISLTTK